MINTIIFAATVGLGDRINKLVSSNFMGMVSSVSVIFDTGATYSCSSNKGDFVNIEDKKFPRKLKGIEKGIEISGFGIVGYYSVRSESGRIIALQVYVFCSCVTKGFAQHLPTSNLHIIRIQGGLYSSLS